MPNAFELIESSRSELEQADLFYGHGTATAGDDAIFLVLHALGLGYDAPNEVLETDAQPNQIRALNDLLAKRIEQRIPSAYLTNKMWFAGLEFYVDPRVLIPRSPLAELIENRFLPFAASMNVRRILEIGTGSGCIALALAHYFPQANVVATDISPDALEVAAVNLKRYPQFCERVQFEQCDLFPAERTMFDLIVTNPPYVPTEVVVDLPAEYRAEPNLALEAGTDGLSLINKIFRQSAEALSEGGLIFFDVGDRWALLEQTYPKMPFFWCELSRGGEGVGMLEKHALSKFE